MTMATPTPEPDPEVKHPLEPGTRACYVRGCREPECVEANATYQREYMAKWRAAGVREAEA
jgi:hypothetical protein